MTNKLPPPWARPKPSVDLTEPADQKAASDHSDRTRRDRIARLKTRLEDADRKGELRSIPALRGVLLGVLDLLADEL